MKLFTLALTISVLLLLRGFVAAQGGLTPPGAPAPAMKTLDQVEARSPIDTAHTPGNATYQFIVTQSGSYYLTGNLNVTTSNGIRITAAGVTLDLNGFQIVTSSGSGDAILVEEANCTIKNGSISGFSSGVGVRGTLDRGGAILHLTVSNCLTGFVAGEGWRIDSCILHDNTGFGLAAGSGSTITSCSATNNTAGGYYLDPGSTITGCSASFNGGTAGIYTLSGCILTNCTARGNTGTSSQSAGILTGSACSITTCTALSNTSTNGTLTRSTGMGIFAGPNSTIKDCVALGNKGDGIQVDSRCAVSGCSSNVNGTVGNGSGIATGTETTLANCIASFNKNHGFSVGETATLAKCTASNNVTGFGISGANALNAINCTVSGNNPGGITGGTGSHIQGCAVYKNLGTGPAISGISVGDGSGVQGCTVRENNGDGIRFTGGCRISGNTCDYNGQNSVTGAGIHGLFGGSRIEENAVTGNFLVGLLIDGSGNTIFKNSARGNSTAQYTIAGGNDVGPISTAAAATSPWANISH